MNPQDSQPQYSDGTTLTTMTGDPFRASDCCFAPVDNIVTDVADAPPGATWQSSHFVCQQCGQECRVHTNEQIVQLLKRNAQLEQQLTESNL